MPKYAIDEVITIKIDIAPSWMGRKPKEIKVKVVDNFRNYPHRKEFGYFTGTLPDDYYLLQETPIRVINEFGESPFFVILKQREIDDMIIDDKGKRFNPGILS